MARVFMCMSVVSRSTHMTRVCAPVRDRVWVECGPPPALPAVAAWAQGLWGRGADRKAVCALGL